ncbi:hypothetical protein TWF730_005853 [Orbilia blumenaviensis]|uniref:NACHT domain-containing protein n=1 Tax=Orbilia blumenaviensis TaxID=1796055 RepID=A0AAV9VJK6_9PEZI
MAEAIGLASGILALASAAIKTTRTVVELINGIKDAPEHISDLQYDVQELHSILLRLETAEKHRQATNKSNNSKSGSKDGADAPADDESAITDQLKRCKTVLQAVEVDLKPILTQMAGSKKQIVWASVCIAFTEKSIKDHSARLTKAKDGLVLTLVLDIRRTVFTISANQQGNSGPSAGSGSAPVADDPPPEYPGFDPKIKRRDSNLIREARNSVISRFKSTSSKTNTIESRQDEVSKQVPTFSQVITSTMNNMSKSVESETKGDYNISTFKMLWQYDLEQVQSLWSLEKETVQHLKRAINDHMCEIFISSLSANASTIDDIKDAAEGTLRWIDTTDEYVGWRGPDEHKFLLLEGKAGSGKSVFTKTLCQLVTRDGQHSTPNPMLLSYFCNKRVRAQESCVGILKAFIYQYLHDNKGDFTAVYKQCRSLEGHWDPAQPAGFEFNVTNLMDVLITILQVSTRPVYCVVDAMDECQHDGDMEGFLKRIPSILESNANARFFMSSRPDWIADNDISHLNPLKIVLHPDITEKDISQVIELELCKLQSKLTIDPSDKSALKKKLTNKAEGMMLWVVLAFRRIQDRIKGMLSPTLKWLERMVEKLPREIFGMYDHIMASIREKYGKARHSPGEVDSSSEDEEDEESSNLAVYGKLVLWVARSARPLTVKELQFALALDMKDTCLRDMKKKINCDIERVIGRIPFLEIISAERFSESTQDDHEKDASKPMWMPRQASMPSSTVRFIHQSAREYILRSADALDEKKNLKEDTSFTYPKLDDACIGNLCVNFLSFRDFDNGPIRQFKEPVRFKEGFKKFLEEYGFLEYSSSYWAYHLNRAPNLDDATKAHVADWICNRKNNMRVFAQTMNFAMTSRWVDFVDGEFGLLAAAGSGIRWLTEYLIEQKHDLNERDEYGRTPYMLSNGRGHSECADLLVEAGADTGMDFLIPFPGRFPDYHGLICRLPVKNIKEFLDNIQKDGTNIPLDQPDEFGRPIVFYACSRGDTELLTEILKLNPSLDFKDKYGRLPIDVTLNLECRDMVLAKMKKDGIKTTPAMLKKVPCMHDIFSYEMVYFEQTLFCEFCGRGLHTFYFHCCGCSNEDEGFNVCRQCHDQGKSCLQPGHKLLGRARADWLVSSLDYTPHMADVTLESPIRWTLENVGDDDDDDDDDDSDDDNEEDNTGRNSNPPIPRQDLEEITPVETSNQEPTVIYEGKEKVKEKETAVVRVQPVDEEKGAGCCKCTIQ